MAHFGSIFPNLGAKKIFLENPALSRTNSYGFLAPRQNLEKVNDTIQRNAWTDGQKDEQTLQLPPGVQQVCVVLVVIVYVTFTVDSDIKIIT